MTPTSAILGLLRPRVPTVAGLGLALGWKVIRRLTRYSFRDKSVLIAGASRGLGFLVARELAREGAKLTILARDEDEVLAAEADLRKEGAEVVAFPCDVRDRNAAAWAVERAHQAYGRLDVLINVA